MEEQNLPLLAVGKFGQADRRVLETAAAEAAFGLEISESVVRLRARPAHALLVDSLEVAEQAVAVRSDPEHATVPVLVLSPDVDELSFATAFAFGADDVVPLGRARPLIHRLRALPRQKLPLPSNGRGSSLIADPDQARRIVLGRVLKNAGYSVIFATNAEEVRRHAEDAGVKLVVMSNDVDSAPRALIERARAAGSRASWIVTTPPRSLREQRQALAALDGVTAMDGFAPAENVLFVSNELTGRAVANQRSSARLLYGTTVAARGAGRDEDEIGFTYNISLNGLYVRSLVAPDDDSAWLELRPPRSERRVRLVGRVAWRRRFGTSERATVPPGFGVEIVDGAAADLAAWRAGYEAFANSVG
jgi:CheY-like chemotaxis protein